MKQQDVVRESGGGLQRWEIGEYDFWGGVRKSESLACRRMVETTLTVQKTELAHQYREFG